MATIILNETPFTIYTFGRNTIYNDNTMYSSAYMSVAYNEASAALYTLAENHITSLVIKNSSNEVIYNLSNIDAIITNIDENLSEDSISVNVNLQFLN